MDLPAKNEDYRKQSYWDERYTTEESYDWFSGYPAFRHLLRADLKPEHRILTLGCGNSALSADMYEDGFTHIVNTDFSQVVIDKMAAKYSDMADMSWEVMDMCNVTYEPETFDVILEKGTIDALLVHEKDPWNTSDESLEKIDKILEQVTRTLKPGGKFISITFSQPHFRRPMYARTKYNWDVNLSTFGNSFHFYYFVMQKGLQLCEKDQQNEKDYEQRRLLANDVTEVVRLKNDDTDDCLLAMDL